MGAKTKEIGGGAATGLSEEYISGLQSLFNGGGVGTAASPDPMGSSGNIMKVLSDILSAGGGKGGNAIDQLLSKSQERNTNAIRARFGASGGSAFGTPAAFAENQYRAESAPQITQAISGMQLQAILPLLAQLGGLSSKGISQRQLVQEKSGLAQGLGLISGVAEKALPFLAPGIGGGGAAAMSVGENFSAPASFGTGGDFGLGNADLKSLKGFLAL